MTDNEVKSDQFGIAPKVAKRLCEWADLEGKYSKEREEKFVERDGIEDQIRECSDEQEKRELKEQWYDVVKDIEELGRQIKYLNQQINKTLRDPKTRSQEVIDPDVLGTLVAPKPEPKKHKDDGQQMLASADRPPSDGSESDDIMEIDEADSAMLADYAGVPTAGPIPSWMTKRWDEAPFGRKQKLDVEIGGKWFATTDQVGEAAIKFKLATPKAMLDEVTLAFLGEAKGWTGGDQPFGVARFLVQEAARQHLREPSATFAGFLAAFVAEGKLETLRDISPLAAAIAEKERDLAGTGDGTKDAPAGPQGGSAGQAKKREAAAKSRGGKGSKKAA